MIGLAVACTILGGIVGASLEPVSFSVSIPIAIMGGFIIKEIRDKKDEKKENLEGRRPSSLRREENGIKQIN